jgi:ABC-type Fe3+/spermidine/putrescine transport system ATPase subunit
MGVGVEVEGLSVSYGRLAVLRDISLSVAPGEFVALLGPSGCGKTTLLRSIAGFVTPDDGRIRAGGRDITRLPPERRDAAMVFQSYALWPHLTVAATIGYGLRVRGWDRARIAARVEEMLRLLRLEGLGGRLPAQLSGGQRQRVALGRALAVDPAILLLDEPMSNLDARVREGVRHELRVLQRQLGITAIHVTHDREEAMILADRIVLLHEGHIAQHGPPEELWARPASAYVADFLGATNRLPVRVLPGALADTAPGEPPARLDPGRAPPPGPALAHFRPDEARLLAPEEALEGLVFHGAVAHSAYPGGRWRAAIEVAGQEALVDVAERLAPGTRVRLGVPIAAAHLFADTDLQPNRRPEVMPAQ